MTRTTFRRLGGLVLALAAVAALAACGASKGSSGAGSAASSAMADPTVSTDVAMLENELLAAWQAHFTPVHPVRSSEAAIAQVFPHGDVDAIASYGVHQLSTSMIGKSPAAVTARHDWAQKVVLDALGPAAAATASETASPGVTLPGTASPVATFSPGSGTTGAGA